MKNWKEVAQIQDSQLRITIISARGEVLEGLEKGFPQYFTQEPLSLPKLGDLLKLIGEVKSLSVGIEILKELGIPYQRFSFAGDCQGVTDGMPYCKGGYNTVANGYGEYFWRTSKKRGATITFRDSDWIVLWNEGSSGSAYAFARHELLIVPAEAFLEEH